MVRRKAKDSSSALNGRSEFFVRQLDKNDKNLIKGVLEFYGFSLYVRGVCGHAELVRQTDQLCTLLVKHFIVRVSLRRHARNCGSDL
jgi:hypothetical protein